jgi:hypothetical protein
VKKRILTFLPILESQSYTLSQRWLRRTQSSGL